jgi:hypothetical protein
MVRSLLAAALLFFLAGAASAAPAAAPSPPAEIKISASVGEVMFRHQAHFQERSIECVQCHHQINAHRLETPHPEYLKSSSINCEVCHDESGKPKQVYDCKQCHRTTPLNVADETLSAKVVIHKQCWNCHPAGTAKEASASCTLCHSGKKAQ